MFPNKPEHKNHLHLWKIILQFIIIYFCRGLLELAFGFKFYGHADSGLGNSPNFYKLHQAKFSAQSFTGYTRGAVVPKKIFHSILRGAEIFHITALFVFGACCSKEGTIQKQGLEPPPLMSGSTQVLSLFGGGEHATFCVSITYDGLLLLFEKKEFILLLFVEG